MSFMDRLKRVASKAATQIRLVPSWDTGHEVSRPKNYKQFAEEGYETNAIVYSCIEAISNTAAEPRLLAVRVRMDGSEEELPNSHPLVQLLTYPNEEQGIFEFVEEMLVFLSVAGNAYVHKLWTGARDVKQLVLVRPDRMSIIPGTQRRVDGYVYKIGEERYRLDLLEVIHHKMPHPTNDLYGLAPIQVLAREIDDDNLASDFIGTFLRNMCVPFGVWKVRGVRLKEEQYEHLTEMIMRRFGRKGAKGEWGHGKPLIIDEDAEYQQMATTPQAMVFPELRRISEARIHAVFGVPPILTGSLTGLERATYANYKEAVQAFWMDTMLPIYRRVESTLTRGLRPHFGDDIKIYFDTSNIAALQEDEAIRWERLMKAYEAGILTLNQVLGEMGYDEIGAEGNIRKPSGASLLSQLGGIAPKGLSTIIDGQPYRVVLVNQEQKQSLPVVVPEATQVDYKDWHGECTEDLSHWQEKQLDPVVRSGLELHLAIAREVDRRSKRFEEQVEREFEKLSDVVGKRIVGRKGKKGLPFGMEDLLKGEDFDDLKAVFAEQFEALGAVIFRRVGDIVGADIGWDPEKSAPGAAEQKQAGADRWRLYFLSLAAKRVRGIEESTKRLLGHYLTVADDRGYSVWQIANGVEADKFPGLKALVAETYRGRHETIARTELGTVANLSAAEAYEESGVVEKVLVLDGHGCEACAQADGQQWNIEEAKRRPLEHPNCVRVFAPIVR